MYICVHEIILHILLCTMALDFLCKIEKSTRHNCNFFYFSWLIEFWSYHTILVDKYMCTCGDTHTHTHMYMCLVIRLARVCVCVQQLRRRWTEGAQDGGSTRSSLNTCLSVSHSLSVQTVIPHQCVWQMWAYSWTKSPSFTVATRSLCRLPLHTPCQVLSITCPKLQLEYSIVELGMGNLAFC